jgi:hypothetical protein
MWVRSENVAPLDLAWPPQCSWLARPHASLRPGPGLGRSRPSGAHDSSPPRLVTVCWVDVVCSSLVQGLNQYAVVPTMIYVHAHVPLLPLCQLYKEWRHAHVTLCQLSIEWRYMLFFFRPSLKAQTSQLRNLVEVPQTSSIPCP